MDIFIQNIRFLNTRAGLQDFFRAQDHATEDIRHEGVFYIIINLVSLEMKVDVVFLQLNVPDLRTIYTKNYFSKVGDYNATGWATKAFESSFLTIRMNTPKILKVEFFDIGYKVGLIAWEINLLIINFHLKKVPIERK